jgi:hypothetical protein
MSQQLSFDTLRIEAVEMRERTDTGDTFPVAIISGISLNMSAKGGASFSKRRVSLPLNGMTQAEAEQAFPAGQTMPKRFAIQQYDVEPYEWTTPDGEIRTDTKRYTLVDTTAPPVRQSAPQSTVEPATEKPSAQASVPTEVGS